ncbi:uncharacterized protein LOC117899472 isoform X4 [Drosophila subobscura]|uniref:uncharacterized protein LOC117899472 isoform X4 n=1 Tax=Drosophila subobscura TaxID=7241 RepID=UPI00155B01FB|nr:uncharacterized protein LOC117899472 isoform X4 [Drosophila subobscura]
MNRRYQTAVPKNLLTCLTFFGIGICTIACTFSGSVLSAPSPTMYPRFAVSRHFATSSSSFTCSSNVREITNRSSKYTNTWLRSRCGRTRSINRHNRWAALHNPNGIDLN